MGGRQKQKQWVFIVNIKVGGEIMQEAKRKKKEGQKRVKLAISMRLDIPQFTQSSIWKSLKNRGEERRREKRRLGSVC